MSAGRIRQRSTENSDIWRRSFPRGRLAASEGTAVWTLPSGQALAEFALQTGFVAQPLLSARIAGESAEPPMRVPRQERA